MKHKRATKTLGRNATERGYLFRTMSSQLLQHGSIVTTRAKAQELRRFFEPLVTEAKKEPTLARRRNLIRKIHNSKDVTKLFALGQEQQKRAGGYLRLTRLPIQRHDAAPMVRVDIVK